MKTKLFILTFFGVFYCAWSQPQVLKENTWYLHKLIVDEQEVAIPINDEITDLSLSFEDDSLYTGVCTSGGGSFIGVDLVYIDNDYFQVNSHITLAMNCVERENSLFAVPYLNIFSDEGVHQPYQPRHYIINDLPDNSKELIITNEAQNKAIYNTQKRLSTSRFEKSTFKIFPNPVRDQLQFDWDAAQTFSHLQLEIYDISGKLCLKQQLETEQKSIPLQNLSSGMYIVKIINQSGVVLASEKTLVQP